MEMIARPQTLPIALVLVILLTATLSACKTETIEVTRIKIMERRVIEQIVVTVEVTRIHRVVETPIPTPDDLVPPGDNSTPEPALGPPQATVTPSASGPATAATVPPVSSAKEVGGHLLTALQNAEQTLLALVQALNSDPLPTGHIIGLYDTLRSAPTLTIPENEAVLQSVHARFHEQIDYTIGQATDLYTHLAEIESGEAAQTTVSPTHLSLARDAASTGTSTVQGLIRELESYLASLP
jgi:hypothetical protein